MENRVIVERLRDKRFPAWSGVGMAIDGLWSEVGAENVQPMVRRMVVMLIVL